MPNATVRPWRRRPSLTDPLWRLIATLFVTAIVLFGVGLLLGLVVVGRHGGGPIQGWDTTVWRWSIAHRGPLVGTDKVIGQVGDAAVLGPICIVLSLLMFAIWRTPHAAIPILAYLGGEGLVFTIREIVHRGRPPTANFPAPGAVPGVHETSFSFPSGHAVAVTAVLFALLGTLTVLRRRWWPLLIALPLSAFVADSRLLLGVHWFSDVAFGMLLGITWGVVLAITCARLTWDDLGRQRHPTPATAPGR